MLSHIYRLAIEYEKLHGFVPNLLFLNKNHLKMLTLQLGNPTNVEQVLMQLGMRILLTQSSTHPSVGHASEKQISTGY
jgi:hypothetical protein